MRTFLALTFFLGGVGLVSRADGLVLSVSHLASGFVSISFKSETNRLFTLQALDAAGKNWVDVSHWTGTGLPIELKMGPSESHGFFRVRSSELKPPQLRLTPLTLKAGEPVNLKLPADGGAGKITWAAEGNLPAGLSLTADGTLQGTPTADSAETNSGRSATIIEIADEFSDPITGTINPRRDSQPLEILVRLSYRLNIQATRVDGPSLRQNCIVCHGPDFKPDIASTALELINTLSGSGAECGTDRPYVAPGDASDSLLYEKLAGESPCGERMPFDGPYLSDEQLNRLARWIRELTPLDDD